MIGGRRVLALIPARGGSKRLPRKNVLPLAGKPVIAWTIEAAQEAATVDRIVLSTDDEEIAAVAAQWKCEVPFMRPPELATDGASSMDVIWHALDQVGEGFDDLVLLQPTSPLRRGSHIDACVRLRVETAAHAVVSVSLPDKPLSHFGLVTADGHFERLPEEMTRMNVRTLNGAVYVADIAALKSSGSFYAPSTRCFEMPASESIDVDTRQDFLLAASLLEYRRSLTG